MKKLIKRLLKNWVLKNFPFEITTYVNRVNTVFIKKGKIREWRSYDMQGNRLEIPIR